MPPFDPDAFIRSRWDGNEARIAKLVAEIQSNEADLRLPLSETAKDICREVLTLARHLLGMHLEIREHLNLMKEEIGA